jgi:hypothetical protein
LVRCGGSFGASSWRLCGLYYRLYKSKPNDTTPKQQNGWTPTGRIDFLNPQSDNFILQAEDTRIVDSMGGVEHREIRWRKATLDEAKTVVVAYHSQPNLAMTASFIVSSPSSDTRKFRSGGWRSEPEPVKDTPVCAENLIRVAGVNESPKLAR